MSAVRDALDAAIRPGLESIGVNYYANGEDLVTLPAVVCAPAPDYLTFSEFRGGDPGEGRAAMIRLDLHIATRRTIVPEAWDWLDLIAENIRKNIETGAGEFRLLGLVDVSTAEVNELPALTGTLQLAVLTVQR